MTSLMRRCILVWAAAPAALSSPAKAADPDARLLELQALWRAYIAEHQRFSDAIDDDMTASQQEAWQVAVQPLWKQGKDIEAEIVRTRAFTWAGLKAKAEIACFYNEIAVDDLGASLISDILSGGST